MSASTSGTFATVGMYKIELEMSISKWGFRKEKRSSKLHTVDSPSVQTVKGVVFVKQSNLDTRQVRAQDLVARQGMSEEILRKETGEDLSYIEMEEVNMFHPDA